MDDGVVGPQTRIEITELDYSLLNNFTVEVLKEATTVAEDLPAGYELKVSADSDVVLHCGPEWVGIQMRGINPQARLWQPWRGSMLHRADESYDTLMEACERFIDERARRT